MSPCVFGRRDGGGAGSIWRRIRHQPFTLRSSFIFNLTQSLMDAPLRCEIPYIQRMGGARETWLGNHYRPFASE